MSTLLEKANEIKLQKDTYIIPGNLKKDVEVFGVTGTYEGGTNPLIELKNNGHVNFNCACLANILSSNLSASEKAKHLYTDGSSFLPALTIGYAYSLDSYEKNSTVARSIALSVSIENGTVTLVDIGSNSDVHDLSLINEADSDTEQYYTVGMTVNDFIILLNVLGNNIDLTLSTEYDMYMYYPSSFNLTVNPEAYIHKTGIENTFIGVSPDTPTPGQTQTIEHGDIITINSLNLASLLENNTNESEKEKYLNGAQSGVSPMLDFATGSFLDASGGTEYNVNLSIQQMAMGPNSGLFLVLVLPNDNDAVKVLSTEPLIAESSCIELLNPMKLSDLIRVLKIDSTITCTCDSLESDSVYTYDIPISSVKAKGPILEKSINVPENIEILSVLKG